MIKLIIFDLSGVCFNKEEPIFLENFAKKHKIDLKELEEFYYPLLYKAEIDELSGKEVWKQVLAHFVVKDDINKIIKEMMSLRKADMDVLEIVKELKNKYRVTYLTNYNKDYWDLALKLIDMKQYFDFGVVSYQIKARKPDRKGFLFLMDKFNFKPEDTLFIDDSEGNITEAGKLGVNTLLFKNKEQLVKDLSRIGLLK